MEFEGPPLVEETSEFIARDGLMYIYRNGQCKCTMRMGTFTEFVQGGLRALRDWHEAEATCSAPIPLFSEKGKRPVFHV